MKCRNLNGFFTFYYFSEIQMQEENQQKKQSAVAVAMAAFLKDQLKEGEIYVGMIVSEGGIPSHHLILLPGDVERNWSGAMAWAAEIGGDLPTRAEQSLLFANAKSNFEQEWYWSNTQHADYSTTAWFQFFDVGVQNYNDKSFAGRARAVRRLPI